MTTSFPKSGIRVVLLEKVHAAAADAFRRDGFDVTEITEALTGEALLERAGDAHILGIRSKSQIDASFFDRAERLLAVGCFCIGTNQVELESSRGSAVPVFNAPFSNTRSVAELTIAEIIGLSRRLFDRSRQMHEGVWQKSATGSHEIRGKTLGIVGYGHIGAQVSVLAEAMGMRVLYYDLVPKLALGNALAAESLGELLRASDFVTLHVPATESTRGLIGWEELSVMRSGASLINNARGSVVEIDALAQALRDGRLAGAAVDVFPDEPDSSGPGFESSLRGLDNVILTPHIGGSTEEAQANIARDVSQKLLRFVNNGSTTGAVNLPNVDLPDQGRSQSGPTTRPHRVLHFHKNVPGVLRQMHNLIGELGVNVLGEYLQTDGELGYVVLDIAAAEEAALLSGLHKIPETIRTRVLW